MTDFALIGAAGFVAVRHMRAVAETGHRLVAALDPFDSVGVLDQHFPAAHFHLEEQTFREQLDALRAAGSPVEYVGICSPNHLHLAHIQLVLEAGAHAICEKPLVLEPSDLDRVADLEQASGRRVFNVLQLRLHPTIIALRSRVADRLREDPSHLFNVDLSYITSRGHWYSVSWKGDPSKSGGVATNVGIHFFDMLQWIFGPIQESRLHLRSPQSNAGSLQLQHARVRWFLSIDETKLPADARDAGRRTHRSIRVDGDEVEFSEGFTDLHTATYRHILEGQGFGLHDARPAIEAVTAIRTAAVVTAGKDGAHPLLMPD